MSGKSFCIFCGASLLPEARFCARCGKVTDQQSQSVLGDGTPLSEVEEITIGRSSACKIVVSRPFISAKHATLKRIKGGYEVIDHDTMSGTFINGVPVRGRSVAKAGDTVGVGSFDFKVLEDLTLLQRDLEGKLFLEAWNLTYRVKKLGGEVAKLLDSSSIVVHPGELVGILGPAGHGKTTLLNALIRNLDVNHRIRTPEGMATALEGETWINTEPLGPNYHAFMRIIGFVPQDDLIHPELTVREALRYTHRLRLPGDHTEEEVEQRIEDVLNALHLDRRIWDQPFGSREKRALSGGERKRVNVAMELLSDPDILILDEPTTGLASTDALTVVEILREIASRGKTVIFTVHQPSMRILRLIDKLAVVAKCTEVDARADRESGQSVHRAGRVVYFGPASGQRADDGTLPDCAIRFFQEEQLQDFPPEHSQWDQLLQDPDAILDGLDTKPVNYWTDKYYYSLLDDEAKEQARDNGIEEGWATTLFKRYVEDRSVHGEQKSAAATPARPRKAPRPIRQWWYLTSRFAVIKWKSLFSLFILVAQAPVIGGVLVMVYHNTYTDALNNMPHIPLFLLVAVSVWFGCINSAREIVEERAIFHRERMLGQSITSYMLSKSAVLFVLTVFQCLVLLSMVKYYTGLHGDFFSLLLVMVLCGMCGVGMGFLLSAAVPSPEAANAFVPILLIPLLVFGGLLQELGRMDPTPALFAQVMPTRWGYEAMLQLEEAAREESVAEAARESRTRFSCPIQRCSGEFYPGFDIQESLDRFNNLKKKLHKAMEDAGVSMDQAGITDEDQQEPTLSKELKEALARKDKSVYFTPEERNTSHPDSTHGCIPTRFTRKCQFSVPDDLADEEWGPINGFILENLLPAEDRRSTPDDSVYPDVPLYVLSGMALLLHLVMYWTLGRRDVGVQRRRLLGF